MECRFDTGLIQLYMEGTIEPLEKVFVEEHLKVCKKCRKELTQLKLLYYELETLDEPDEVPAELEQVRNMVLDNIFDKSSKYGIKDYINLQKESLSLASEFVNFVPGRSIAQKGIKVTGSILGKASKKSVRFGLKLIQART